MNGFGDYFIIEGDKSRAFVIIVGMDGSLYGDENRYLKMAQKANALHGYTIFGFCNPGSNWNLEDNGFSFIMNTVKNHMTESCEIYVFGFSAGASFTIFHAWEYPDIKRILVVNPPLMVNYHKIVEGIRQFKGISTLIIGEQDQSISFGKIIERDQKASGFSDVIIYPKANHLFTGLTDELIDLPFTYLLFS